MADQPDYSQPNNVAPKNSYGHAMLMSIPFCMVFGVTFGVVFDNMLMGICIGFILGVVVGAIAETPKTKQDSGTNDE